MKISIYYADHEIEKKQQLEELIKKSMKKYKIRQKEKRCEKNIYMNHLYFNIGEETKEA